MSRSTPLPKQDRIDPLVVHARREALVILAAFMVCLIWSISWCWLFGYPEPDGAPVAKVLGMPSWVFWGVLVPWIAADLFGFWFCFVFMADDPLSEAEDEPTLDDGDDGRRPTRPGEPS